MKCPLCGHDKPHKHGKTSKGSQRYFCPKCQQTFTDTFDTLNYRRQVSEEEVQYFSVKDFRVISTHQISNVLAVASV